MGEAVVTDLDLTNSSNYQAIYVNGELVRGGARTNKRWSLINWKAMLGKTVLDLGCSNGMLSIEAKKHGAKYVLGVDRTSSVLFARHLAEKLRLDITFWQVDIEKEFLLFAPQKFDFVFFCAMLNHMRDKQRVLEFIDNRTRVALYYETNFENKVEPHLDYLEKYTTFHSYSVKGVSENVPEGKERSYSLIKCVRGGMETRGTHECMPVTFLPVGHLKIAVSSVNDFKRSSEEKYQAERVKVDLLKENIDQNGVREPLLVVLKPGSVWRVVEGGHRLLAARELGLADIPCRIVG